MSLIPNESYSFPDHFVLTIGSARKTVRQTPVPPPEPESPEEKIELPVVQASAPEKLEAPADAMPVFPEIEAEQMPAPVDQAPLAKPNRAFIPSVVPATLKRKLRWNARATAPPADPPANEAPVIAPGNETVTELHQASPAAPKPKPDVWPKISLAQPMPLESELPPPTANEPFVPDSIPEARIVESPSADLVQTLLARSLFASAEPVENEAPFQNEPIPMAADVYTVENIQPVVFADESQSREDFAPLPQDRQQQAPNQKHRSPKMRRFLFCEAIALGILVPFAILGLLRVFHNPIMIAAIDVVTIAAAVTATVMPILFFAISSPLPRGEE